MSRAARAVCLIWICCTARLWFYAAALPLWEGYDEWGHFSVVRLIAFRGQLLPPRDSPLPRDVTASLNLVPLPWSWKLAQPPQVTHDDFWQLPLEQRKARVAAFEQLPRDWQSQAGDGSYRAHEAYQPPLYYWIMAPLMLLFGGAGMATQLLALRCCGAVLASLAIPLTFLIAREGLSSERMAIACTAVLASMPGFALLSARSGNDCLAIAIFSLLIWCVVRLVQGRGGTVNQIVLACALGFGLLTKAYFLTAIPAVAALCFLKLRWRAVFPMLGAIAIGGWWYLRTYLQTGTLTGLNEFSIARARTEGVLGLSLAVPWLRAIDSILFSHIYAGGWSFLQVRSWMYHVFYLVSLLAIVGWIRLRPTRELLAVVAVYAAFWLGELYDVVILWAARGVATSMGYYLYGVVAAEVPLCVAGLSAWFTERRRVWSVVACLILFAALDLFAMHAIAIPYYTGLTRHRSNGALMAFHLETLRVVPPREVLDRLTAFTGIAPSVVILLWIAYLAGTFALIWLAMATARNQKPRTAPPA